MDIREQLIRDEGFRLAPYRDTEGLLTIGVGRNLDGVGLYPDEVEYLLNNDIARAKNDVLTALPWAAGLHEARLGVLVNMRFNMGMRRLLGFRKLLEAAERGDWAAAANEMLDSKWAKQVGDRATRLAEQMLEGVWI